MNSCGVPFGDALLHQQVSGFPDLDVTCVGDPDDLRLGSKDPDILRWAEEHGRVLVSADRDTMIQHVADHLAVGRHSPGLFVVRPSAFLPDLIDVLLVVAFASEPDEWRDRFVWIPWTAAV